jgi:type VI protein secretion system component Hcp
MPPTTCTLTIETPHGANWGGDSRVVLAVLSSSWDCSNYVQWGATDGPQRPAISNLAVIVRPNRASPLLARACFLGETLPRASLAWHEADAPEEPVLAFMMTGVLVWAYSHSGTTAEYDTSGNARLYDQLTLSPRTIEMECRLDPTAADPFAVAASPARSGAMNPATWKIE